MQDWVSYTRLVSAIPRTLGQPHSSFVGKVQMADCYFRPTQCLLNLYNPKCACDVCGHHLVCLLSFCTESSEPKADKVTSSTPGYMNVELEDKSVPMTDNPSYEHVEKTQLTKPLYGNF